MRLRPTAAALLALVLLAACGRGEEAPAPAAEAVAETPADPAAEAVEAPPPMPAGDYRIVAVELGTQLDEQGRVARPRDVFAPTDAIHMAVVGVGTSPGLTVSARWFAADGTEVSRAEQALVPEAPTVVRFTLSQPGPWPIGAYRVEVAVNDRVVETRSYEVR